MAKERHPAAGPLSDELFRIAFEYAGDAFVIHELYGRFLHANQRFCELVGRSPDELGAMTAEDLTIPEYRRLVAERMAAVMKEKAGVFETALVHKNGTIIPAEICTRLFEMGGKKYVFSVARDITERKLNESVLQESEWKHRTLAQNIPGLVYRVFIRENGRIEFFNDQSVEKMTGYAVNEFAPGEVCSLEPYIVPDDRPAVVAAVKNALTRDDPFEVEYRFCKKDGEVRHFLERGRGCTDAFGKLQYIDGVVFDITERKQAEFFVQIQHDLLIALSATLDLGKGLELCLEAALRISKMDGGGIYLFEKDSGDLVLMHHTGLPDQFIKLVSRYPADSPNVKLIRGGKPHFTHYQKLPLPLDETRKMAGVRGIAIIPFGPQNRIIGCLNIASFRVDELPQQSKLGLETIAIQIGNAVDRLQAEEEVRSSELRFRKIFEESPIGMALVDIKFHFIKANAAFSELLGYSEQELALLTFKEITHPSSVDRDVGSIPKLINGEIPQYKTEKQYVRKNGEIVWGAVTVSLIRDASGKFLGCLAMIENIDQRKKAEAALLAEKERLLVTLRSIGDGVITTDINGRITLMNKVAEELTGWTLVEGLGRPLDEVFSIISEKTREHSENPVEKVMKTGGFAGLATPTILLCRNGTERHIADSGAPIRDRNSKIIGVVLVFRDITEKLKYETAMQNAQKLESLGILAGGIAHDFNNLLSGIFGFMDLAREMAKTGDAKSAAEMLVNAMGVFDRAKNLTQQLLTFSKGGVPIRKTQSVEKLLHEAVHFVLSGSPVSASFEIPKDLWLCDIDENQMAQVISNIVINARQAMPLGGNIEVRAANIGPHEAPPLMRGTACVEISIRDQGIGIENGYLSRIFDPFFTTKQEGSGLGLSICYSIVSKHEGQITIDSAIGKGSTFHVFLPASTRYAGEESEAPSQEFKGTGKILIMDDEPYIREVALAMLRRLGFIVMTAPDGDEAISLVRKAYDTGDPFICAILDLTVPGGRGGKATVEDLREIDPSLKIIASSGYSNDPVMADPISHGFFGRLIKPYRTIEIIRLFKDLLIGGSKSP